MKGKYTGEEFFFTNNDAVFDSGQIIVRLVQSLYSKNRVKIVFKVENKGNNELGYVDLVRHIISC